MKLIFATLLLAFCCVTNFAQNDSVEAEFEKNKSKFNLEKSAEAADSMSYYDYFFYTDKGQIIKVREIWSSTTEKTCRVSDYYFNDGKIVAVLVYELQRKYYKAAEKGTNVPLKLTKKFYLSDSRLTVWIENGNTITKDDKRWQEMEKEVLEWGKSQLENYDLLKGDE